MTIASFKLLASCQPVQGLVSAQRWLLLGNKYQANCPEAAGSEDAGSTICQVIHGTCYSERRDSEKLCTLGNNMSQYQQGWGEGWSMTQESGKAGFMENCNLS